MSLLKIPIALTAFLGLSLTTGFSAKASNMPDTSVSPSMPTSGKLDAASRESFRKGLGSFGIHLYHQMGNTPGNILFSPLSIAQALGMAACGAKGETEKEFQTVLEQKGDAFLLHGHFAELGQSLRKAKGGCELSLANSLWMDKGFSPQESFRKSLIDNYQASSHSFDSVKPRESANQMNAWIKEATLKRITDLIKPSHIQPNLTRLTLINAIAFKGKWAAAFDKAKTTRQPFHTSLRKQCKVSTLSRKGRYAYGETELLQILEMPYKDSSLSFVVVLPKQQCGILSVEKRLNSANLESWLETLSEEDVEVQIPRLKLHSNTPMEAHLQSLGMKKAFSPAADFSGISKEPLSIDKVVHGAQLELNEEGTVATAATAITMTRKSISLPKTFKANHPFFFMLRDRESGAVLFMGKVADPR